MLLLQLHLSKVLLRIIVAFLALRAQRGYMKSHHIGFREAFCDRSWPWFPEFSEPRKLEHALAELDLPCLTLKGTVFERRRVIRCFHAEGLLG